MTATTPSKRGPYAVSRRRRNAISAAVLELVDEIGHENVTTALVAARCEMSEATVLYHFPSRDHLLVAALERLDDSLLEAAQIDSHQFFDLDALRDAATPAEAWRSNRARLTAAMRGSSATPGHPAADHFRHHNERAIDVYAGLISGRQRAGLAHPDIDPREVATQLLALWEGLAAIWILDPTVDIGELLIAGYRRMAGENWMRARDALDTGFAM